MVDPRSYTKSTLWALVALGRSSCYWPDPPCSQRAIVMVKGQPVTNLEIAHIYAAHPDGPRYRADMTDAERRHASNVILLCTKHHMFIDKVRPGKYPAEVLTKWKADREKGALDGLQGFTDEDIPAAMTKAMKQAVVELRDAIEQLKTVNPEAASVLLDVDVADLLNAASHRLADLPDTAEMLYAAATRLPSDFNDGAELLLQAAASLPADLTETPNEIRRAAKAISDVVSDLLPELDHRIRELRRLQGDF